MQPFLTNQASDLLDKKISWIYTKSNMTKKNPFKFGEKEKAVAYGDREKKPSHVFLLPKEKKFPVKVYRNGKWVYSKKLLKAALGRARQHNYPQVATAAERILKREFGYVEVDGLRKKKKWISTDTGKMKA